MRETGKPTFVVSDCHWRARLRTRGGARSRGSQAVSTHGLNTQRVSAIQKVFVKGFDSTDVYYIVNYSFLEANRSVIINLCDLAGTIVF
jgi:hypothetical protein